MRKTFIEKRIPTLLGLLFLIGGLTTGVILVQQTTGLPISASLEKTPEQVRITNISDKSFAVSWITQTPTVGFVAYGTSESLGNTKKNKGTATSTHHVTIENLKPSTGYYFKVASEGKLYGEGSKPYQATTAPEASTPSPPADVIHGTVVDENEQPVPNALVYVSVEGISALSSITDNKGGWAIPLSNSRSNNLAGYASYSKTDALVQLFVQSEKGSSSATVLTGASHPVPPIKIGQTHDFRSTVLKGSPKELPKSNIEIPETEPTVVPKSSRFEVEEAPIGTPSTKEVAIVNISEGEEVNTTKPQVLGTGSPGTKITITIQSSTPYKGEVVVGQGGQWTYIPPGDLEPGEHMITLAWKDQNGQTQTLKRTFTVLAQGQSEIPSFTASPSGQTATATPTPSPTPTPLPVGQAATTSATPTATPTATPASTISATPTAGNLTPTLGLFIMGIGLILAGLFTPKIKLS